MKLTIKRLKPCGAGRWAGLLVAVFLLPTQVVFGDEQTQPGGVVPITACVSEPGGTTIYFTSGATPFTGFHNHDNTSRPNGTMDPPSAAPGGGGCAMSVFNAPLVAGVYTVTAYIDQPCYPCSDSVQVTVITTPYLQILPNYADYTKDPPTSQHQESYWGTFNTVVKIQEIASQFRQETGLIMRVNDISLPWGGRFDIGPSYPAPQCYPYVAQWWGPPHCGHMNGRNVDIPFGGLGAYRARFVAIASGKGAAVAEEGSHYHLTFPF